MIDNDLIYEKLIMLILIKRSKDSSAFPCINKLIKSNQKDISDKYFKGIYSTCN